MKSLLKKNFIFILKKIVDKKDKLKYNNYTNLIMGCAEIRLHRIVSSQGRAFVFQTKGNRFESYIIHQMKHLFRFSLIIAFCMPQ